MHPRERVIRDRFSGLACAHCGTMYAQAAIVVLARRRTKWMVLACCHTCDRQAIFVVTFPNSQSSGHPAAQDPTPLTSPLSTFSGDPTSDGQPIATERASQAVSAEDVDTMRQFLSCFDGNFQSLFSHTRHRLSDDSAT